MSIKTYSNSYSYSHCPRCRISKTKSCRSKINVITQYYMLFRHFMRFLMKYPVDVIITVFGPVLAHKWVYPQCGSLRIWGLETQQKSWPTLGHFWVNWVTVISKLSGQIPKNEKLLSVAKCLSNKLWITPLYSLTVTCLVFALHLGHGAFEKSKWKTYKIK